MKSQGSCAVKKNSPPPQSFKLNIKCWLCVYWETPVFFHVNEHFSFESNGVSWKKSRLEVAENRQGGNRKIKREFQSRIDVIFWTAGPSAFFSLSEYSNSQVIPVNFLSLIHAENRKSCGKTSAAEAFKVIFFSKGRMSYVWRAGYRKRES